MSYINWNIKKQNDNDVRRLANSLNCSLTVSKLLINRGIDNVNSANKFLYPTFDCVHNPFLLTDMSRAVDTIKDFIKNNKRICIYGDYDVDGITSVSVLYLFLKNFTDKVGYFIPDRFSQGYGVNKDAIDRIYNENYDLIITVDTGISAVEEIDYANKLGISVIVTDHHECQEILPNAVAVINPKRKDDKYPFSKLAGVGVVYKLICALDEMYGTNYSDNYIDLVAVGIIADIMPLLDENRYIVKAGIEKITKKPNMGLKCLIDICSAGNNLTSASIGFAISPRINAAGRLDNAEIAVKLFTESDEQSALKIAQYLCDLNAKRQSIENDIMQDAIRIINEHDLNSKYSALILWNKGWHSGVIGIVASKLKEKYNKPVILFSVDEVAKGSGRSVAPFNLYQAFEENKDILIQFGGHKYAAGVLVDNNKLYQFRDSISQKFDEFLSTEQIVNEINVECVLSHSDVSYKMASEISMLHPFGKENEVPLFCIRNVKIVNLFPTANNKHLRLKLGIGSKSITAFYFSVDLLQFDYREGDLVDIVCELNENEYKNHKTAQLIIKDLRYSQDTLDSFSDRREMCNRSDSVIKSFLPTRADIAVVYRFFHQAFLSGRKEFNIDTISNVINKDCLVSLNYEKVYYSIKVLIELGIFIGNINGIDLKIDSIADGKKFSLTDSALLMRIYEKAGVKFGN